MVTYNNLYNIGLRVPFFKTYFMGLEDAKDPVKIYKKELQSISCSNIPCADLDVVIEPVATAGEGAERGSTIILQGIGGLVERGRRVNVVEGRGR